MAYATYMRETSGRNTTHTLHCRTYAGSLAVLMASSGGVEGGDLAPQDPFRTDIESLTVSGLQYCTS